MNRRPFFTMDQIELERGLEAEIRSFLDRSKPETSRGAEISLERLGFTEDDYDGPLCDWADDQYNRMSESEREDAGWRFWEDEAYGARLPRVGKLRRMLVAGLAAVFLLLGGCGERTRINDESADLAVYVGSVQWMHEHLPPGADRATSFLGGYYDPEDGSVTINEQLHGWRLARVFTHELLGHAWDHQKPRDGWELLARYESPNFTFNFHSPESVERGRAYMDTVADPIDAKRAACFAAMGAAMERALHSALKSGASTEEAIDASLKAAHCTCSEAHQ